MIYEGKVFRPPSEWRSLIVQITVGCSHNTCTFCTMYKEDQFHLVKEDSIFEQLENEAKEWPHYEKVFLADGNALCLSTDKLLRIMEKIKELFPKLQRISAYGTASDILRKSVDDLITLRESGLELLYVGMESGSNNILTHVNKGETAENYVAALELLEKAKLPSSITLISGLGGKEFLQEHALESAALISKIQPTYLSFLTLYLDEGAPLLKEVHEGTFELLTPEEVLYELRLFLEHVQSSKPIIFRCNHASNYAPLAGTLPQDREALIETIDQVLVEKNFKPEKYRQL